MNISHFFFTLAPQKPAPEQQGVILGHCLPYEGQIAAFVKPKLDKTNKNKRDFIVFFFPLTVL